MDLGYEYLDYYEPPNIEMGYAIDERSHVPLLMGRVGIEVGGTRLRLRGALEGFLYGDRGIALAIGGVIGL